MVKDFLRRCGCDLLAIDTNILVWPAPSGARDWGWKDDNDVDFEHDEKRGLIDDDLPADFRQMASSVRGERLNRGELDSVKYCLTAWQVTPDHIAGRLRLTARPLTYFTGVAVAHTLVKMQESKPLRKAHFYRQEAEARYYPLVPNILSAEILVITGDNKVLLQKRRLEGLDFLPGFWTASAAEQLNAPWRQFLNKEEVHCSAREPDGTIFSGLRRALKEEVSLRPEVIADTTLRLLGVGFEYDSLSTKLYAMAELPDGITYGELQHLLMPPYGSLEFDKILDCEFSVENLAPVVVRSDVPLDLRARVEGGEIESRWLEKWINPASRMLIALGIRRRFGEEGFERILTS